MFSRDENIFHSIYFRNRQAVVTHEYDQVGERIFTLDQAELAFRSLAAGGHKGKLVVRVETERQDNNNTQELVPWK